MFLRIMMIFYGFVILCLTQSALAQVSARATCPQITPRSNFEPHRFLGRWYEAERFYTHYELNSKCNRIDYSRGRNSSTYNRLETFTNNFTGKTQTYHRQVRVPEPRRNPAKGLINFPLSPTGAWFNKWVVGTDYDSWGVIYGCTQFGSRRVQYSWIVTRERNPPKSTMDKAHRLVQAKKINRANYVTVDQRNCDDDEMDRTDTIRFAS